MSIDPQTCTLCGHCAEACPTGALTADEAGGAFTLTFDATSCPACAQCLPRCPELARGAIRLRECVDLTALDAGRTAVASGRMRACEVCAGPLAPDRLLAHLGDILGAEHAGTLSAISRRCPACRRVPTL